MTKAVVASNGRRAERMLRHVRPRARWMDGIPGSRRRISDNVSDFLDDPAMIPTVMIGSVMLAALFTIILIFEMRLSLMATMMVVPLALAYVLSHVVYDEAEKQSERIWNEGHAIVHRDVHAGAKTSLLFPSDESMAMWNDFLRVGSPSDVREATMRLAALLCLKPDASTDEGQRLDVARAAENVLLWTRDIPPPSIPMPSKRDRLIMSRIVGETASMTKTAVTGDDHADGIASIVREALSADPDLVDGHGARIDRLIEVDLPGLVEERDAALRYASMEEAETARAEYAQGIEAIERSVSEALGAWKNARSDALATRVRFLVQRRGEQFRRMTAES